MDTKIQSLTEKLYNEGVEKGKEEASKIIEEAKAEKDALIKNAKNQAEQIIANATKKAEELRRNSEAELKLYASQSVEALKSEIANLISDKVVNASVAPAFEEKNFLQQLILKLISTWQQNEKLVVEVNDAENLKKYFENNAKQLLDKNIEIKQINGNETSFTISPANGAYKIKFGEQEFIDYFKSFLRPQLIDTLF